MALVYRRVLATVLSCACFAIGQVAAVADWPQILGSRRDGHLSGADDLPSKFADGGPTLAWKFKCGSGYAGAAIAGGSAFVFHRRGDSEILSAISLADGKPIWESKTDAGYAGGIDRDTGPRCVPTVAGDQVVTYGASGRLSSFSIKDGTVLWSRDLRRELGADDGYFGAGSSPLVVKDQIIVNAGSKKAGIVSIGLADGKTRWQATSYDASYSSPIAVQYAGQTIAFVVTRLNAVGIQLADGKVLFDIPFGARGPTVNAATPVDLGKGQVFLTASYGIGSCLVDLSFSPPKVVYRNDELLSSQYTTPVCPDTGAKQRLLIGGDGREDMGNGSFVCIDPIAQQQLWSASDFGVTHTIAGKSHLLAVTTQGQVALIAPDASKLNVVSRFELPNGTYRPLPAFSAGRLVVRSADSATEGTIYCYQLGGE